MQNNYVKSESRLIPLLVNHKQLLLRGSVTNKEEPYLSFETLYLYWTAQTLIPFTTVGTHFILLVIFPYR